MNPETPKDVLDPMSGAIDAAVLAAAMQPGPPGAGGPGPDFVLLDLAFNIRLPSTARQAWKPAPEDDFQRLEADPAFVWLSFFSLWVLLQLGGAMVIFQGAIRIIFHFI